MAYTRPKTFADDDPSTPINASALHAMQDAVYSQAVADAATATNTAVTNAELGPNVKRDFGAIGDGVTDDRAAFQNAINILNITGGGSLFIPVGNYKIGSPGIVWPQNTQVSITLVGHSPGSTGSNSWPTRLFRNGAYPIITAQGTGQGDTTVVHGLNIRDVAFDGANQASPVLDFRAIANSFWTRIAIRSSFRAAFNGKQIWNCHFTDCHFGGCGDAATSTPAILLTDSGLSNGGTNTVHFTACEWEGNLYDDVQLTGTVQACAGVGFVSCKFERSAGVPIRAGNCGGTFVNSSYFFQDHAFPAIIVNGGLRTSLVGNGFSSGGGTPPTILVQLFAGQLANVIGNTFLSNGQTHIRLEAGFGEANVMGNASDSFGAPVVVSDNRNTKTGTIMGRGTLQMSGGIGVYGAQPPASRPVVTGSRGGNAAVASLVTQLAALGLVTDFTSA